MLINYCSQTFIVVNLLYVGHLSSSLAFVVLLWPFIILVTLYDGARDFWLGFGAKLSVLRKRLSLASISSSEQMVELIPPLLESDDEPSFAEMATWLLKALPANDRPEAYTLLVSQLLPKKLERLPPFMERRWYVENLYESLSDALQEARPNERLQVLRRELCLSEIRRLSSDSVILAIARYMQEHPHATPDGPMYWLDFNEVSKWSAMPKVKLQHEASKRLEQLERWDLFAKANQPSVWEEYCIRYIHIELNLGCAYSGTFPSAMGELALFLDAVGASFNEIHLH